MRDAVGSESWWGAEYGFLPDICLQIQNAAQAPCVSPAALWGPLSLLRACPGKSGFLVSSGVQVPEAMHHCSCWVGICWGRKGLFKLRIVVFRVSPNGSKLLNLLLYLAWKVHSNLHSKYDWVCAGINTHVPFGTTCCQLWSRHEILVYSPGLKVSKSVVCRLWSADPQFSMKVFQELNRVWEEGVSLGTAGKMDQVRLAFLSFHWRLIPRDAAGHRAKYAGDEHAWDPTDPALKELLFGSFCLLAWNILFFE